MATKTKSTYFIVDNGIKTNSYDEARLEALHESKISGGRAVEIIEYLKGKETGWSTTEQARA